MHDLKQHPSFLHVLYYDHECAIHVSTNHVFHEGTKHLDIDCHSVGEKLEASLIQLLHVSSQNQADDVFTKAHGPRPFYECLSKLDMVAIYQLQACGGEVIDLQDENETS